MRLNLREIGAMGAAVMTAALLSGAGQNIDQSAPPIELGGDRSPTAPLTTEPEMNARLYESVRLGLEFLATQQNADGSFGPDNRFSKNVGITGLCALAFMSDGHLPGRGKYGTQVEKALQFVLSQCTETGLIVGGESHGPMYGHGFATLFLGEIYGMGGVEDETRVREALV
jgi:hypothetical protein